MEESEIEPLQHDSSRNKRKRNREAIIFLLLAVVLPMFFYYRQCKEVLVIDGAERIHYSTFSRTVEELLQEKGLSLQENDKILPAKGEQLEDGDIIVIKRAIPVFLTVDGRRKRVWTHASEAAGLLREQNILLQEDDQVFPALNHQLKPGDTIAVVRVEKEYEVYQEKIPYRTIASPTLI